MLLHLDGKTHFVRDIPWSDLLHVKLSTKVECLNAGVGTGRNSRIDGSVSSMRHVVFCFVSFLVFCFFSDQTHRRVPPGLARILIKNEILVCE